MNRTIFNTVVFMLFVSGTALAEGHGKLPGLEKALKYTFWPEFKNQGHFNASADLLGSSSYSRALSSIQIGHFSFTAGLVRSEGTPVKEAKIGGVAYTHLKDFDFRLDANIGAASISTIPKPAHGHPTESTHCMFGGKMLGVNRSKNVLIEASFARYCGPKGWVNLEPMGDAFFYTGKGFYAGFASSAYFGPEPHHGGDSSQHAIIAETHGAPAPWVHHIYMGAGVTFQPKTASWGFTISREYEIRGLGAPYWAFVFNGSVDKWGWLMHRRKH